MSISVMLLLALPFGWRETVRFVEMPRQELVLMWQPRRQGPVVLFLLDGVCEVGAGSGYLRGLRVGHAVQVKLKLRVQGVRQEGMQGVQRWLVRGCFVHGGSIVTCTGGVATSTAVKK